MIDFILTAEDAEELRRLASLPPREARSYLQDRPELARRVQSFPPEIRIEVCRILYRSFDEESRSRLRQRRRPGSDLVDLLEGG